MPDPVQCAHGTHTSWSGQRSTPPDSVVAISIFLICSLKHAELKSPMVEMRIMDFREILRWLSSKPRCRNHKFVTHYSFTVHIPQTGASLQRFLFQFWRHTPVSSHARQVLYRCTTSLDLVSACLLPLIHLYQQDSPFVGLSHILSAQVWTSCFPLWKCFTCLPIHNCKFNACSQSLC